MKVFSEKKYLESMKKYGYSVEDLEKKGWTWYKGNDKKPVDLLPFMMMEEWTEED